MGLFIVAVVSLVVGAVTQTLMPGKDPVRWIAPILVAFVAGWAGVYVLAAFGLSSGGAAGLIAAITGAIGLLAVYRLATRGLNGC
jgi:uncharacterized membrane protein YeaQ/YmgE (transglycosylase-associated protein family)